MGREEAAARQQDTVAHGMAWDGMGWGGVEWGGMVLKREIAQKVCFVKIYQEVKEKERGLYIYVAS